MELIHNTPSRTEKVSFISQLKSEIDNIISNHTRIISKNVTTQLNI